MTQTMKVRKPTEIQSPVVNRCTDKITHEVFYMVKSDSSEEYYRLTWNESAARYQCSCPATKPCKHMRAVSDIQQAKAEQAAANIVAEPTYGTCGHLARRADRSCGCC